VSAVGKRAMMAAACLTACAIAGVAWAQSTPPASTPPETLSTEETDAINRCVQRAWRVNPDGPLTLVRVRIKIGLDGRLLEPPNVIAPTREVGADPLMKSAIDNALAAIRACDPIPVLSTHTQPLTAILNFDSRFFAPGAPGGAATPGQGVRAENPRRRTTDLRDLATLIDKEKAVGGDRRYQLMRAPTAQEVAESAEINAHFQRCWRAPRAHRPKSGEVPPAQSAVRILLTLTAAGRIAEPPKLISPATLTDADPALRTVTDSALRAATRCAPYPVLRGRSRAFKTILVVDPRPIPNAN